MASKLTNKSKTLSSSYYLSIISNQSTINTQNAQPSFDGKTINIAPPDSSHNKISSVVQNWRTFLISRGIPLIYNKTQETFTPQQVNYDLIDGVNFKKGCYIGQEIVARTHYLGRVKRRMYRFRFNSTTTLTIATIPSLSLGQIVVSPKLNNQEVGVIVELAKDGDTSYRGLVSLQIDCINSAFLDLDNTFKLLIEAQNMQ